jgi:hypothetical protein
MTKAQGWRFGDIWDPVHHRPTNFSFVPDDEIFKGMFDLLITRPFSTLFLRVRLWAGTEVKRRIKGTGSVECGDMLKNRTKGCGLWVTRG